jgi:hypothetical protein
MPPSTIVRIFPPVAAKDFPTVVNFSLMNPILFGFPQLRFISGISMSKIENLSAFPTKMTESLADLI